MASWGINILYTGKLFVSSSTICILLSLGIRVDCTKMSVHCTKMAAQFTDRRAWFLRIYSNRARVGQGGGNATCLKVETCCCCEIWLVVSGLSPFTLERIGLHGCQTIRKKNGTISQTYINYSLRSQTSDTLEYVQSNVINFNPRYCLKHFIWIYKKDTSEFVVKNTFIIYCTVTTFSEYIIR